MTKSLTLLLQIDPTAEPVAGTVGEAPGPTRAFSGWTQLAHALDAAIAEARPGATPQESDG